MKSALAIPFSAACLAITMSVTPRAVAAEWPGAASPPVSTPATSSPAVSAAAASRDTLRVAPKSPQDSLLARKARGDTVTIVRHGFNHRQQIITGSVIMSCLVMALLTMNNYNPR